ncbi:MAG: SAM-dependent methyltransferase [Lentisphaeria bacterium]
MLLHGCKPGFEEALARELAGLGHSPDDRGRGWLLSNGPAAAETALVEEAAADLCFATFTAAAPAVVAAPSVNALAGALRDWFATAFRTVRVDEAGWPAVFLAAPEVEGLGGRVRVFRDTWLAGMAPRMGRVFRLVRTEDAPPMAPSTGLLAWFTDFNRLHAATRFRGWGQRRMRDDPQAPSRSYLKVEEAFVIMGREPGRGETVTDLGAAPGGWSYAAAQRGAQVTAVDNGPLKAGAAHHPLIEHLKADAFRHRPAGGSCDWLFCDMIEDPRRVLAEILLPWLDQGWCRCFVVNFKVGHADPVALVERLRDPRHGLAARCATLRLRQLHHDREEITAMGERR